MAGEAKTNSFMLGTATVMISTMGDLYNLNPVAHSLGLVKNFKISGTPSFQDLTQGVKNSVVYSVMTGNVIKATAEAYEYTAKNMTWAMGLDGTTITAQTVASTIPASTAAAAVSATVASGTGFVVGDYVQIQSGTNDLVWVRKLTAVSGAILTWTGQPLPVGFPAGATVRRMSALDIGSKQDQIFYSMQVVGTLADSSEVTFMFPKVRIVNGFSMGFMTDNFDNMPLEFAFYDLVPTDQYYADFPNGQGRMLTAY